jgi:hypothetical protein
MDWKALTPAIVGALIVAVGWVVSHYLNKSRDIAAEKRKTRISFLIEAYRRLEDAGNRPLRKGSKHVTDIESALADIQLLGTPKQVDLARSCGLQFSKNGTVKFDPLLHDLRNTLRQELDLEAVDNTLTFFRIAFDDDVRPSP